jgi:hypothetical protein
MSTQQILSEMNKTEKGIVSSQSIEGLIFTEMNKSGKEFNFPQSIEDLIFTETTPSRILTEEEIESIFLQQQKNTERKEKIFLERSKLPKVQTSEECDCYACCKYSACVRCYDSWKEEFPC